MDRDYAPLSSSCVKNLVDKLFEKRKSASLEVERIIKDYIHQDKHSDIARIIGYFSQDFIQSANPHTRKGGLLGLASAAIGLNEHACLFHGPIILPIIRTFSDNDPRVRYYACEALFNVMKITRKETLHYLSDVLDAISRGVSDSDSTVRPGALQCDRLLKEIIMETDICDLTDVVLLLKERIYTNNPYTRQFIVSWITTLYAIPGLKISVYLPQLLDGLFRILGDPNPDLRRQCEMLLTDLLKEIEANPNEIALDTMINSLIVHCRLSATACALADIALKPSSPRNSQFCNLNSSVVVDTLGQSVSLTQNTQNTSDSWLSKNGNIGNSPEQLKQRAALKWIKTFVEIDPHHMLPYASGIIGAVLPCFMLCGSSSAIQERRVALETAVCINETLLKAVRLFNSYPMNDLDSHESKAHKTSLNSGSQTESSTKFLQAKNLTKQISNSSLNITFDSPSGERSSSQILCTDAILEATFQLLNNSSLLTRLAALRWITVLAEVCSADVFSHVDRLLPEMLKLVSDPADEMVHSTISLIGRLSHHTTVIGADYHSKESVILPQELVNLLYGPIAVDGQIACQIPDCSMGISSNESSSTSSTPNTFCLRFLLDLIELFNKDSDLLRKRGDMIITDLCQVLGADTVYCTISTIISYIKPLGSAFVLVQALNRILLTQPVLHDFRKQLRAINTEAKCQLFEKLYRAWCYNPVSLLSLCMLTENYKHCSRLVKSFGDIVITVEILCDLDQLIQMIESPIFASLRMHLLDKRFSADLRETLYCLLMCLPQTDAFQTLWRRLQCLPPVEYISDNSVLVSNGSPSAQNVVNVFIDFNELFDYFHSLQKQHDEYRLMKVANCSRNEAQTQNHTECTIVNESRSNRGSLVNDCNKSAIANEKSSNNTCPLDVQNKIDCNTGYSVCSANDYLIEVMLYAIYDIFLIA
ncbi:Protein VAC14 like [Schistosoma japonicum]|nr:Protein VAC14 like [Schistosoma japonicum]